MASYDWSCALYHVPMKSATLVYRCSEKTYKPETVSNNIRNGYKMDHTYKNVVIDEHPAKKASDKDVCKMRDVSTFWMNESI